MFLAAPWWWRRPLDGLIIGALVGLGFQIYEDIIYITSGATTGPLDSLTVFFDRVFVTGFSAMPHSRSSLESGSATP